jgi:hypothetical protein
VKLLEKQGADDNITMDYREMVVVYDLDFTSSHKIL